jgi:hypothetical protein
VIAKLRRRHRIAAFGFWMLVPAVFVLGSARSPAPRMDVLPEGLERSALVGDDLVWSAEDPASRIRIGRTGRGAGSLVVEPLEPLRRPDVLVYWLAAEPAPGDGVPDGARLAGRLDGNRPVSVAAPAEEGGLLFFSLGHQERLYWVPLSEGSSVE